MKRRCAWANGDRAMLRYHDEEWGVPVHGDRRLFELLILEAAQAGLSWATILRKRAAYRRAFDGFEPARVARFGAPRIRRLLGDAGIVRNRAKIEAAVGNARAVLAVRREHGTFDAWLWRSVAGAPRQSTWTSWREVPAETDLSRALSRGLKAHGFTFVGPTICYAFMQATGMVNDHTTDCFRWREVRRLARSDR
ncbi:MAG: DNA-3-methyladenine glycosylase I [Candidatus Rokuibacteriota bacterium]|nr:MAG: DNA-3-methyladenine glycosylase I [Candidatus Rokubacteria bacterium]